MRTIDIINQFPQPPSADTSVSINRESSSSAMIAPIPRRQAGLKSPKLLSLNEVLIRPVFEETEEPQQQQKSVASAETGNAHVTDNLGEQNAVLRSPGYLRNITEEEDRQQQVPQSTKRSNTPPIRGENTIRYTSTDTAIHRRDDASLSGSSRGDVQHATADDSASTYSQCSDLSPYRPAIAVPRGEQARVTSESAPGPSRSSLYPFNGTQSQTSPGLDSLDHALPASAVYERPAAVDVEMIRPVTVTNYGSLCEHRQATEFRHSATNTQKRRQRLHPRRLLRAGKRKGRQNPAQDKSVKLRCWKCRTGKRLSTCLIRMARFCFCQDGKEPLDNESNMLAPRQVAQ